MVQVSTVYLHYDDKLCTLALVMSQMYGFPCNGFHLNVVSANLAHVREICPLSWYTLTQMSPSSVNRVIIMCIHVCMHHCNNCISLLIMSYDRFAQSSMHPIFTMQVE